MADKTHRRYAKIYTKTRAENTINHRKWYAAFN